MPAAILTSAPRGEEPLDAALRPVHKAWIEEARRYLQPALEPGADFWARWPAVRYLSDSFQDRYRLERALMEELRPFVRPEVFERLECEADRVHRLRLELDRIGRRRGTSADVAAGSQDLLDQLGVWCAEIEVAVRGIIRSALSIEGAGLLAQLEESNQSRR